MRQRYARMRIGDGGGTLAYMPYVPQWDGITEANGRNAGMSDIQVIARCERLLKLSGEYDRKRLALAYRDAIKANHPDLSHGDGDAGDRTRMTAAINGAYATLARNLVESGGTVTAMAGTWEPNVEKHAKDIDPSSYVDGSRDRQKEPSGPRVEIFPNVYGTVVERFDVSHINRLYDHFDVDLENLGRAEMKAELIRRDKRYERETMGTGGDDQPAIIIDMVQGRIIQYDPHQLHLEIQRQGVTNPYTRPKAARDAIDALKGTEAYARRRKCSKAVLWALLVTACLFVVTGQLLPAVVLAVFAFCEGAYGIASYPLTWMCPGQYERLDFANITTEELQGIPAYLAEHGGKSPLKGYGLFHKPKDDPTARVPSEYVTGCSEQ